MLEWLHYSARRAMGIETQDEQEKMLGEQQVFATLDAIHQWQKKKKDALQWIAETEK